MKLSKFFKIKPDVIVPGGNTLCQCNRIILFFSTSRDIYYLWPSAAKAAKNDNIFGGRCTVIIGAQGSEVRGGLPEAVLGWS